jgi:hypothetical protein
LVPSSQWCFSALTALPTGNVKGTRLEWVSEVS